MLAHCVTVTDPFNPQASRQVCELRAPGPLSALALSGGRPFVLLRNGAPVLRADWGQPVADGDLIAVVVLPQGGGGGSNPLRMLLLLAVSVFAPYAGQWVAGQMGPNLATNSLGAALVNAGSTLIGTALVNALIPPPRPPSTHQAQALAAPSPTYNLQAQGNMARLDQAIPVQYGRMLAYPDFAAQPYAEYAGNEQYLYQLLCLGQGEYDIEAIRIEDTAIENFAEISYEVVNPGASVSLFPTNVTTSSEVSGQEMAGTVTGTYTRSGTTITVTRAAHGYSTGRVLYLDFTSGGATDGAYTVTVTGADTFTVTDTASGTIATSNVTIQHYLGGFVANASGTLANAIGLDFVMPRGLYHLESNGDLSEVSVNFTAEARTINDAGTPIGAWTVLGSQTYTTNTTTPQRYSERYNVTAGRYEVRVRRTNVKESDSAYGHEILWGGLRAYLPETRTFPNVTLIALRMRASNNLSAQASRKINVVSTRKLPIWNGTSWSANTATQRIAWALADACRNTVYGARLPDSRVDLAALLALDAVWGSRGDQFCARFDSAMAFWEALTKIAATGRAKPYMQGGIVRFARDAAASVPVALYSLRNIVRGSFSIDYILPSDDNADSVEVSYFDRDVWMPRRVTASLDGSDEAKPAKIDLFGCTKRQQAYREGLYQAASNRYRRRLIKFSTEMEGFIPAFGDLIAIQHDMPAWGQFGEAVAWDAATRILTLDNPMDWSGGTHYAALRTRAGGVDGPYQVTQGATPDKMVFGTTPDTTPYTGRDEERTHVVFGWASTWSQLAKVVAVRPRGLYEVEIEAINEDPSVHTAETGKTAPAVQTSQLTTRYTKPLIADLTLRASTSDSAKALLTWTPAPGAETYQIEMAAGTDPYAANAKWTRVGETSANSFAVTAIYGAKTLIRVRGVGLAVGPWVSMFYGDSADYMWTVGTSLMWSATSTNPMWRY
ncbi:MAG: host specificity factor TipJ family phage tail protein [Chloroflexota bacterium]